MSFWWHSLACEHYGVFTNLELTLSHPGVHVIYAANGRGKTTLCQATIDLLFGIPKNSPFAKAGTRQRQGTRLHGTLTDNAAGSLAITRTKTKSDSLVDANGTVLSQESLASYLGGVDRKTYTNECVLNQESLRRGGQSVLEGQGRLGELLFSATGFTEVSRVLQELSAMAESIYTPRASTKPLNQAIAKYEKADEQTRLATTRPQEYLSLTQSITHHEKTRTALREQLSNLSRQRERWQTLLELRPLATQVHQHERVIAHIQDLPHVVGDDVERLRADLAEVETHGSALRALQTETQSVLTQLQACEVPDPVVDDAATIHLLHARSAEVADSAARLINLHRQASESQEIARQPLPPLPVGLTPNAAVSPSSLAELTALLEPQRELKSAAAAHTQALNVATQRLERAEEALSVLSPVPDLSAVQALLHSASHLQGAPQQINEWRDQATQLRIGAQRSMDDHGLGPWSLQHLPQMSLPARSVVTRTATSHQVTQAKVVDLLSRREALEAALALRDPATDEPLPMSTTDVEQARAMRDDVLASTWDKPRSVASFHTVTRAIAQADAASDAWAATCREIGTHHADEERRRQLRDEIEALTTQVADHQTDTAKLNQQWEQCWGSLPRPVDVSEGEELLHALVTAKNDLNEAERLDAKASALLDQCTTFVATLREQLLLLDLDVPQGLDVSALTEWARNHVEDLAELNTRRRQAQTAQEEAEADLIQAENAMSANTEQLNQWQHEWVAHLRALDLCDKDSPDSAEYHPDPQLVVSYLTTQVRHKEQQSTAVLTHDQWSQAFDRLLTWHRSWVSISERLDGADPDPLWLELNGFKDASEALSEWEPHGDWSGLVTQDIDQVEAWVGRLTSAQTAIDQRRDLEFTASALDAELKQTQAKHDAAECRLTAWHKRLAIDSRDELTACLDRSHTMASAKTEMERDRRTLSASSVPLSDCLAVVQSHTSESLAEELAETKRALTQVQADISACDQTLGELRTQREHLETKLPAIVAGQEMQSMLAEVVEHTRNYAVYRTAAAHLHERIEQHRQDNADPIVERAQSLFTMLTGGQYPALDVVTDGGDSVLEVIDAVRGSNFRVSALSEGTRDQLYLALRLATVEVHAAARQALPLLLDDVLMTFDDERTEHTLNALHEVGSLAQVLVLTHHQQVANRAKKLLGAERVHAIGG